MKIDILPGTDIRDALADACGRAKLLLGTVYFEFNGEKIYVSSKDTPADLYKAWQRRQEAAARAHRASPGYIREQTARAERAAEAQGHINLFLQLLDGAAPLDLRTGLKLIYLYQAPLDHVGVLVPWSDLAEKFSTLAPAKWGVGRKDLKEPGQEQDAARWIIGQAVDAFRKDLPPHPMLRTFAEPILKTWGML